MTTSKRTTASRLAVIKTNLAARDEAVLKSIGDLRLATTKQIERLHFEDSTQLANARATTRTLQRLRRHGLVQPLERQIGGVRAGSAGYIWALGPAGQRLVTGTGPAGGAAIRRPWTPSLPFVAHRLGITELAVRLHEAARAGALELVRFDAEPTCWRRYTGPHGAASNLKPDAFAMMGDGQYEDAWFIEIDMSTESPAALARKREAYLGYWRSGQEQRTRGVFPWVLFVVPDHPRRWVVERALGRPQPGEPELFVIATTAEAVGVLAGGRS